MHPDFWHERWEAGQIGFHQSDVNPTLQARWPALGLSDDAHVLVPLCGKSHDLRWLAAQGHPVTGVELSGVACTQFFEEGRLDPETVPAGPFRAWHGGGIRLLEGDVLHLEGTFDAAYDRAATIALPPDLRRRYAARLAGVLRPGAPVLLITLDYPQPERDGPPFAVSPGTVADLYGASFSIEHLQTVDLWSDDPRYREDWGLSRMDKHVFVLRRRP